MPCCAALRWAVMHHQEVRDLRACPLLYLTTPANRPPSPCARPQSLGDDDDAVEASSATLMEVEEGYQVGGVDPVRAGM